MATQGNADRERKAATAGKAAKTTAQTFCFVVGATLVAVGVLGFIFGGTGFNVGNSIQGKEFIIFEVNGWHNIVHIASGVFLLAVAAKPAAAASGALAFGIIYVVVTVWGFVDGNTVLGLLPVNTADNILHLALAALAVIVGATAGGLGLAARRETGGATA